MPTYMYIDDVEAIPPTAIERLNRLTVIIENLIMGESHSQGLSMQQMDALPLVNVTQEQHQQALNCSVCLEDYQLDETVKELPCKHVFHPSCITNWLRGRKNCPICRGQVAANSQQNNFYTRQRSARQSANRRILMAVFSWSGSFHEDHSTDHRANLVHARSNSRRSAHQRVNPSQTSPLEAQTARIHRLRFHRMNAQPTTVERNVLEEAINRRTTRSMSRRLQHDQQRRQ